MVRTACESGAIPGGRDHRARRCVQTRAMQSLCVRERTAPRGEIKVSCVDVSPRKTTFLSNLRLLGASLLRHADEKLQRLEDRPRVALLEDHSIGGGGGGGGGSGAPVQASKSHRQVILVEELAHRRATQLAPQHH